MQNEIMLVLSLVATYSTVLVFYKLFGKNGLYAWTAIATIAANIEVLIMVDAFGMDQTLGNILFASTFLVTDILSEIGGKKAANKAVKIGILTTMTFIAISQSWFYYIPNATDWVSPAIREVFANTPRLMIVGLVVYATAQAFDVWLYHAIWKKTQEKYKDAKRGLWLRNNGSTLLSQLLNTILYTLGAFAGMYDTSTLINIMAASYVVFIVTSLVDTPIVYLARKIKPNED